MDYPIAHKKYLKSISTLRKALFTLWAVLGASLLFATPGSITLPLTFGQVAGMLFVYAFYAWICWITRRNLIVPSLPFIRKIRFTDGAIAVYNHRGRLLYDIPYRQINAVEVRALTMDWAATRDNVWFIHERFILLFHGNASCLEDLQDVKLDWVSDREVYSKRKLPVHPQCLLCMYNEEILREIGLRAPIRSVKWL